MSGWLNAVTENVSNLYFFLDYWIRLILWINGLSSQGYGFSTSHVWMWELDYKESWARNNWCFWIVVLEKTLESPLKCKETQPVHPIGNQSWIFIGRTNVEGEGPIFWPPDGKKWLIGKDPDAGKDFKQEKKGTTEDEMVGWRHRLDGQEFKQAPGVGDGQGSLACCSPWGRQESKHDWAAELDWLTILHDEIKKCTRVPAALHPLQNLNLIW